MCASFVTQVSFKDLVRGYSNVGWHISNVCGNDLAGVKKKKARRHMYFTFICCFTAYLTQCIAAVFLLYWDQIFLNWNISLHVHLSSWGLILSETCCLLKTNQFKSASRFQMEILAGKYIFSSFLATDILSYPDETQVDRFWVEPQPGGAFSDVLGPDCN